MAVAHGPGVAIAYETVGGSGDPTVLVHGSWVDRRSWGRLVPLLADSLRVITYDRRGHGDSTGPTRAHPVRDDAGDLARVLEAADLYPAHVVGHSYGSGVALRLALDRPDLVRSVVVHEPPFIGLLAGTGAPADEVEEVRTEVERLRARVAAGDREGAAREFVGRFTTVPGGWDRLTPEVRARFVGNAPRWAEEIADPEATGPSRAELGRIGLPALVTSGEDSPPLFHRIGIELASALPYAVGRTLPGTGHVPHLTDPEVYAGALARFLLERDVPSS